MKKHIIIFSLFVGCVVSGAPVYYGTFRGVADEVSQISTNALTKGTTNFSFGSGRYYGPIITDGGIPLTQNNGWGSVDLQVPIFPEVAGAYSGTANTNSAGGIACYIGGGFGNLMMQTQEGYDAQGWKMVGSGIGFGAFNTLVNVDTGGIGIGDHNYIGPSPDNPQNYVDDSFIPFGISCAIFDAIDAGAMGWACTNSAGGGSWVIGWHCWLDGGGTWAAGENVWNRGTSHGIIGLGKNILMTNAANAFVFGQNIKIDNAFNAGAVGLNITNTGNHGDYQFGVGTNAITVRSNGQLVVSGPLFIGGGVSTNRSRATIVSVNPFPDIDTPYTNRNQLAELNFTIGCATILGSGDIAFGYLLVDQDADGVYEENDNSVGWGDQAMVLSGRFNISRTLQPNARFMLAQTNAGFGIVEIVASRISYK